MKKVLIINPYSMGSWDWSGPLSFYPVKFNLLSLYSHLKNAGVETEVLDLEVELGRPTEPHEEKDMQRETAALIKSRDFDIAAVCCYTSYSYESCVAVGRMCREANPGAWLVAGGYHPSSLPQDFAETDFDAVITGEAELALEELAGAADLPPGARPAIITGKPLPLSPAPNFRLKDYPYPAVPGGYSCLSLSRGCPFQCDYCAEPLAGGGWRHCSVEEGIRIVDQIVAEQKPACLAFHDPIFGFHPAWRREFLERLIAKRFKTSFSVTTRLDILDERDIDLMARLNMTCVFGVDSTSETLLQIMRKTTQPARYLERLSSLLEYGAKKDAIFVINQIFNHPGATPESLRQAVDYLQALARRLPSVPYRFNTFTYSFHPGAPQFYGIAEYEKRYGTQIFHKQWWRSSSRDAYRRATDVIASREAAAAYGRDNAYWKPIFAPVIKDALDKSSSKLKYEIALAKSAQAKARDALSRLSERRPRVLSVG